MASGGGVDRTCMRRTSGVGRRREPLAAQCRRPHRLLCAGSGATLSSVSQGLCVRVMCLLYVGHIEVYMRVMCEVGATRRETDG